MKMTIVFAALAAIMTSTGLAEMKLMSFNVCHCSGMDSRIDIGRTAARIRSENPTFACLQELDRNTLRSNGVDQPAELGRLTGMHPTFAKAIPFKGGEYGIMMLSREKPMSVVRIPLPGREPRVLLLCEFTNCVVGTTHLSVASVPARKKSIDLIRKAIDPFVAKKPVFLMGDWNSTPKSEVLKGMGEYLKVLSDTQCQTFHGKEEKGPKRQSRDWSKFCIDYIACDKAHADLFKVVDAHVIDDRITSDHAPIVVTVTKN